MTSATLKHAIRGVHRWRWWGLGAAVVLATLAWQLGSGSTQTEIATVAPARDVVAKTSIVTGTIAPHKAVKIKSTVNGVVAHLAVEPGQRVKKGDLLARLQLLPDPAEVNEARSRLRKARFEFERAAAHLERRRGLREQQVIAENDFQDDLLKFNLAQEAYHSAKRELALKAEGISDNARASPTRVVATIDGVVLERPVGVGDVVIKASEYSDGTTLMTLADLDRLLFKGEVDEADAGRLMPDMPLSVTIGALPEQRFAGRLEFVAPVASRSESGRMSYAIHAALETAPATTIRAGYSASAEILLARRENVLTLPEHCIRFDGDRPYVMLLTAAGPEKRYIVTGLSNGVRVEIVSGVSERDRIVPPSRNAAVAP